MNKESVQKRARKLLSDLCLLPLRAGQDAEITLIAAALTPQWQPIETAPVGKNADGAVWLFLAWGPEGDQSVGEGFRWRDKWFAGSTFYCAGRERKYEIRETEISPTHWMPLPEVPEAA